MRKLDWIRNGKTASHLERRHLGRSAVRWAFIVPDPQDARMWPIVRVARHPLRAAETDHDPFPDWLSLAESGRMPPSAGVPDL